LIGTEGARLLREYGAGETPQALAPRRLPGTPAESEHLEWKSTTKFNTAFQKESLKGMMVMADKKKREKPKFTLTSAQEVGYQRDFKLADRAGGYNERRTKH
jgi:hypothetical protein